VLTAREHHGPVAVRPIGRVEDVTSPRWIALEGAVNVRDLGGRPTADGRLVRPDRLIRADNLQGLSAADVRTLVDDHGVRAIVDLRTGIEVDGEGPGPMTREPQVRLEHLSLYPEAGHNTDALATDEGAPVLLPWLRRRAATDGEQRPRREVADIYLGYLDKRSDSVVAALRLIAGSKGATIVHCAAGKDRTGVVIALALAEVAVTPAAIVEDYTLSAERIDAILGRLLASPTYASDMAGASADTHAPRAETMQRLLDAMDERYGGVPGWLRQHGWTDADATALRHKLLD
jgi:protein-tyrosine phosphatase